MLIKLFSIPCCHHVLKLKPLPWNFETGEWTQCDYLCIASKYGETDFIHCVQFLWKFSIVDEFYLQIFQSQEMIPQVECAIHIYSEPMLSPKQFHCLSSSSKQYLRCCFVHFTIGPFKSFEYSGTAIYFYYSLFVIWIALGNR